MVVNKNIVEKVKKLFTLAADKSNENEANVAFDMARKLMREYGIAEVDVVGSDINIDVDGWKSDWLSQVDSYARIVARATAVLFNCEQWMVRSDSANKYRVKMCFAGESTDLALCVEVWPYLVKMAKRLAESFAGKGWTPSHRTFAESFALRIHHRVDEMRKQEEQRVNTQKYDAANMTNDQKYALVVVKKEEGIQKWFAKEGIEIKMRKASLRGEFRASAASAGYHAGDNVNLNFRKQVQGNGHQPLIG